MLLFSSRTAPTKSICWRLDLLVHLPPGPICLHHLCICSGFMIWQIHLILYSIWDVDITSVLFYLTNTQRFDIIHQLSKLPPAHAAIPDPITGLYVLKNALHTDQLHVGNILPLYHCSMPVQLVPCFDSKVDTTLTCVTSMKRSREFFLNAYFNKHIFQYLCSSHP